MARARSFRLTPLLALAALPALAGLVLADTLTPLSTPTLEPAYSGPGITGPAVPAVVVRVPAVEAPGLCTLEPCAGSTGIEGRAFTTPAIEGVGIATQGVGLPAGCSPLGIACIGAIAIPGQDLGRTPDLGPQAVHVQGAAAPAACSLAPDACAAGFAIPGAEQSTPAVAPIQVVPAIDASASVPGIAIVIVTDQPEFGQSGPIVVPVDAPVMGHVDVALCNAACPAPQAPDAPVRASGEPEAEASIGGVIVAAPDLL